MQYAALARAGYSDILYLTEIYNNVIAGGKWEKMMDKSPYASDTGAQFGMPYAALANDINDAKGELPDEGYIYVPAENYSASRGNWQMLDNLGVGGKSITVWPITMPPTPLPMPAAGLPT